MWWNSSRTGLFLSIHFYRPRSSLDRLLSWLSLICLSLSFVVSFVGSSTISPSIFNTSSYSRWPHTPLQTTTQYGSLLRSPSSSRKPLPTQSHQPQTIMMVWWSMMVDVFFFLKPHIQSIVTINGFFPTQSRSSIAFFIELNHWSFGFPGISVSKASACNAGDLGSTPGFGKIPRRREWLPTPVFWLGEFHGLYSPGGRKESDMAEWLHLQPRTVVDSHKQVWFCLYENTSFSCTNI